MSLMGSRIIPCKETKNIFLAFFYMSLYEFYDHQYFWYRVNINIYETLDHT